LSPPSLKLRADLVYAIHGIFALLILPCSLLLFLGYYGAQPILVYLHYAAVVVMVVGTLHFGRCPLVELEERFRTAAGQAMPYEGSFTVYFFANVSGVQVPETLSTVASRLVVFVSLASLIA
jgi:hypothetical protein